MGERGRYRTKQQECILECLRQQQEEFCSVEKFMDYLQAAGMSVSQTTVYRALDRLTEEGLVAKIPSVNGSRAQYRYIGEEETLHGKLVCLKCGRTIPLTCSRLVSFTKHIGEEHQFVIDHHRTVLYGYCSSCSELKE